MTAKHPLPSGIDDEIDRRLAKVRRDQITARSKVQREMDGALPHDPVNRPSHYLLPGGLEVRDIQAWMVDTDLGMDAVDMANAVKYLLRAPFKSNYVQDLRKCRFHLDELISRYEREEGASD